MGFANTYIQSWLRVAAGVDRGAIERALGVLSDARNRDASIWTIGNGGGSALASHLAVGLTLNTLRAGGRPFRATCLSADAVALSAAINDFGADHALRALLKCNARPGDVLCAFSVSGKSANINNAVAAANESGLDVIALVGDPESATAKLANHAITLGSAEPGIAEDVASAVMHAMYCGFMYEGAATLPAEFSDGNG
jgi:D-sedoheptulose 7-phosphate isomerase